MHLHDFDLFAIFTHTRNNRQRGRIQAGRETANKYDGGDLLRGYREGGYRLRRVRRPLRLQRRERRPAKSADREAATARKEAGYGGDGEEGY
ncbi:hypothetical protein E3N88_10430 [Mikania micrantha]|uniref:Uncharacterized protein n=1 Tax=Mikania micrantha TaxID=192012 RepID=A0A5N6PBQ9_9ASTR|nr:hypothetical protein E3N88_10430 [Mikania micrantha]